MLIEIGRIPTVVKSIGEVEVSCVEKSMVQQVDNILKIHNEIAEEF